MFVKCKEIYIGLPSVYSTINSRFFVMKKSFLILFLFLLSSLSLFGQQLSDVKILQIDDDGLTFEFTPVYLSENHFRDELNRILPLFDDASVPDFRNQRGYDFRYKSIPIALPSFTDNRIKLLDTEFEDIKGVTLKPTPKLIKDKNFVIPELDNFSSNITNTQKPELVKWGEIGLIRDLIVGNLLITPYEQIDANTVRVYKKFVIRVDFGTRKVNLAERTKNDITYKGVLNESQAKNWIYKSSSLNKITNSKLSNGNWYRIKIKDEGIYKLDFNFLKSKGIDLSGVDPRTIQIFGNGGRMLSELPEDPRPFDLIENAIIVVGEEDGKFDQSDYIIFYAPSVKGWEYNPTNRTVSHYYHHYEDYNYVWLTFGQSTGKRMTSKNSISDSPDSIVTTTTGYILNREFKNNIASTGRRWFGDSFNDRTTYRVYNNRLPELAPNGQIVYKIAVAARSNLNTNFTFFENNDYLGSINVGYVDLADGIGYYAKTNFGVFTHSSNLSDQRSLLKISYNATDAISTGYLDYFEIHYSRNLSAENDAIMFFSPFKNGKYEYVIKNFSSSDIRVFDVTDFSNVKFVQGAAISGMQISFRANESADAPSKYFAIGNNGYLIPTEVIKIGNQNLKGITGGYEFIIISPKEFLTEAYRLKNFKESRPSKPISTLVVNPEEIYNEFSCGLMDVTAFRDFIRYAYLNWNTKPKYVLLFGDGHYDYRNITGYGKNYIPAYETIESLYLIYSYPTDDFYGRIIGNDVYVDISVGRFTVQSIEEAKNVVNKVISYETNKDFGLWRNLITLVADDGKTTRGDDGPIHTSQSEEISKTRIPLRFNQKKIYLIQYPTVETAGGRRKPAVNNEIINTFNSGTLVMNFIGHGNPEVWTHEYVFEKTVTIPQLKNTDRLCFLSAATCDFGDYDKPSGQSSMELLLSKGDGGIIAGFTAARAVWSDQNAAINKNLFDELFSYINLNSEQPTIGDAYFQTKKFRGNDNDQKYHLFGDPSIYLLAPAGTGEIDSINGNQIVGTIELKTMNQATISGSVRDKSNNILTDFNGEAIVTVYDSKRYQEVPEWYGWNGPGKGIELDGGIIYRGRVSIRNGLFRTDFMVPKDVSYERNNGKILAYYFNQSTNGVVFNNNIRIVSADSVTITDTKGPELKIFFDNDYSYGSNLVSSSPLLIVKLEDETGINTTGLGIGHNIEAVINDDVSNAFKLNEYFQGDLDQGNKKGEVRYKLSNLPLGRNKLKVTAWDVFNNFSSAETFFEVVGENKLVIKDVFNYPNPMKDQTVFTFQHSYDQPVNVTIKIYSVSGRLVHKIERENAIEKFVKIPWDGRDQEGDYLGNGVYLYKIIVSSLDNSKSSEALGKLALIK